MLKTAEQLPRSWKWFFYEEDEYPYLLEMRDCFVGAFCAGEHVSLLVKKRTVHAPGGFILEPNGCNPATNFHSALTASKTIFAAVKKIFAFIMAVLVLSFSMMSCADETSSPGEAVAAYSPSKSDSHDAPHVDRCSPFCSCGCCATFSFDHVMASHIKLPPLSIKPDAGYLPAPTSKLAYSFWQPPRYC